MFVCVRAGMHVLGYFVTEETMVLGEHIHMWLCDTAGQVSREISYTSKHEQCSFFVVIRDALTTINTNMRHHYRQNYKNRGQHRLGHAY